MVGFGRSWIRGASIFGLFACLACGDAAGPDEEPVFELRLRNLLDAPFDPQYTPEFTVVAVNDVAKAIATRPGALDEVGVRWPDGAYSLLDDDFQEIDGETVLVQGDRDEARPLPTGSYELTVRYDDLHGVTLSKEHSVEALDAFGDLQVIQEGDQATVSWVGPPQPHEWEAILFRYADVPGPDEETRIRSLSSGEASGDSQLSVVASFSEIPEEEGGRVYLVLTNEANLMVVGVTVKIAPPPG